MKVSDYLTQEHCIMNLKSKTKEEAIKEIASLFSGSAEVTDLGGFIEDIFERENLGSTGIGQGVAIPHSRTKAVKNFVIAFGRSLEGIDFSALDGEKVNLIFLMGTSEEDLNLYLRLLAELSKLLMNSEFRKALTQAQSAKDVVEAIRRFEGYNK